MFVGYLYSSVVYTLLCQGVQAELKLRVHPERCIYLALHHSVIVERKLNDFVVKRCFVVSED